ncbi:hypothetical protein [Methanohalophilus sp.]|uniref:hypothetical protein n=1 Tax=Methanohalophilus sp. TaxID=1966352 RepID=UPI00262624C2|nr:hypothetical protein [Methanohalophilus sp.]MDK2892389.1 hypothetical protein [Methanohalophilus sp.]
MMKLRSGPYCLKIRPDIIGSERQFREKLNLSDFNGVLFNAGLTINNSSQKIEYDAILWKDRNICFMEYKDSLLAHKRMKAKRVQQVSDKSRDVARAFGFLKYDFVVVVNGEPAIDQKSGVRVIPLEDLPSFKPKYKCAYKEIDTLDNLITKYSRDQNPVNPEKDKIVSELKSLKKMIIDISREQK